MVIIMQISLLQVQLPQGGLPALLPQCRFFVPKIKWTIFAADAGRNKIGSPDRD